MRTKPRIDSILRTNNLDLSIAGFRPFSLSDLDVTIDPDLQIPKNLRLGHLVEKIVAELIRASTNYNLIHENIQLIEGKDTIGEIDFIIENTIKKQLIHMELAYKFYLFDPSISSDPIKNWIGPNKNDSLIKKIEKLKKKQFPLLYHRSTKSKLNDIDIDTVSQALCFLVSLYVPFAFKERLDPIYEKAIKGYYLSFEQFKDIDNARKSYHLPIKQEWGMEPSENKTWTDYNGVEKKIKTILKGKQAVLCWQKNKDKYLSFFIVWW